MYETPKLNRVGEAEEVILGAFPSGGDLDFNYIGHGFEFAGDDENGEGEA